MVFLSIRVRTCIYQGVLALTLDELSQNPVDHGPTQVGQLR